MPYICLNPEQVRHQEGLLVLNHGPWAIRALSVEARHPGHTHESSGGAANGGGRARVR